MIFKYYFLIGVQVIKVIIIIIQFNVGSVVNIMIVIDNEEFCIIVEEFYKIFIDFQWIVVFICVFFKVFEGVKKGGRFELFGGNVFGEYLELEEFKKIVQSWCLDQWFVGYYFKFSIEFDQNDVDYVMVMCVEWIGVFIG